MSQHGLLVIFWMCKHHKYVILVTTKWMRYCHENHVSYCLSTTNGRGDYKDRVVSLHINTGGATYLHAWWTVPHYQFCIYCISIWIYIVIRLMILMLQRQQLVSSQTNVISWSFYSTTCLTNSIPKLNHFIPLSMWSHTHAHM
jgi:hypothetical protein